MKGLASEMAVAGWKKCNLNTSGLWAVKIEPIHIGRNVWIGAHATGLPGVAIGDNAVIAAGAMVTKDVPANVIAAGIAAKQIRSVAGN